MNKFNYVVENSTLDHCLKKTAEELFELGEVVMKMITKPKGADSSERLDKLVEEAGDVLFNVRVLIAKKELSTRVLDRITQKTQECVDKIDKDKVNFFVNEDKY